MVLSSAESLPIQTLQLMQKERENSDDYEESYHTPFLSDTSTFVLLEEKERCTIAGCNYSKTIPPNETIVHKIDKSTTTSRRH
jgi:hypothetical protein